jgi:response regulator RpfG family c-di-GMP phosphodiesterase
LTPTACVYKRSLHEKNPPDIIISYILMPVMDGFMLGKEWRKDSRLRDIPFVFYEEIIIEARIIAIADVLEAMASHRPYRPALGIDVALEEIKNNKGILYDEDTANACLNLFRKKNYKIIN